MAPPGQTSLFADLEHLSRDYSEVAHNVLLVIGGGSPEWAAYLSRLDQLPHTRISADTLARAARHDTRCLLIQAPMQLLPEINRWLVEHDIALYQMRHLDR